MEIEPLLNRNAPCYFAGKIVLPVIYTVLWLHFDSKTKSSWLKSVKVHNGSRNTSSVSSVHYVAQTLLSPSRSVFLQVLVLLDVTPDQSMVDEGVAREVINRIQKLRKKVGWLFQEHY